MHSDHTLLYIGFNYSIVKSCEPMYNHVYYILVYHRASQCSSMVVTVVSSCVRYNTSSFLRLFKVLLVSLILFLLI